MNFKIKKHSYILIILLPLIAIANNSLKAKLVIEKDSIIIKKGYQLTLRNSDPKLNVEFKNNVAERFFAV